MTRPLLVFIGSPNVGPYINVMTNSVDKYEVDRIVLIDVRESPSGQQVDFESFANKVLWDTLCGLVEGTYNERGQELPVPKDFQAYKKLKEIFGSSRAVDNVNYKFLRKGIEKLKVTYGTDAIVDLTGVPKRVAIDVLTACLAVGMSNVMLFELEKPAGGVQALYHNLRETDYNHVVLPDWEPLIGNIEFFSARQNRQKLWVAVTSILISLLLTVLYQLVRIGFGEGNWLSWLLIGAIAVIGLVGGVTPIVDAWGGIRLVLSLDRRDKKI